MKNSVSSTSSLAAVTVSSCFSIFCFLTLFLCLFVHTSYAQTNTNATTDPSEVRALNSLFMKWAINAEGYKGNWNISGEPCSGDAIGAEVGDGESYSASMPSIKCNCSYDNGSTCHITEMKMNPFLKAKGVIPEEIAALTHLTHLDLDDNLFSGPLPNYIENLTNLQYLSIAKNAFSGAIPNELGSLTELSHLSIAYNAFSGAIPNVLGSLTQLSYLSIGSNNFSGKLPPELGNLANLQELYIQSCGDVGGEIPSTFGNFVNMQKIWITDSSLTGKIPDFIGNWSQLLELRIEGTSLEGPIPSSFAHLTSLTDLRISDLSNVSSSSSLDFIKKMKNLNTLVLKNAIISDSIPLEISEFENLNFLDLSFNTLTGQIPSALFNMSFLHYLLLGNNNLSGTLPPFKDSYLYNVDVSYNELSGDLPQWFTTDDKQSEVNIVANNYVFSDQNTSSSKYRGIQCLQRTFSCNTSVTPQPRLSTSIDCGGSGEMINNGTIDYNADSDGLGSASFYVDHRQTWAVSNTGSSASSPSADLASTKGSIRNTDNKPGVFQSSRTSSGSLRYYCLGLENGHYNLTLMFAETSIPNRSSMSYLSFRRRMFDIYVQGTLKFKDFDIAKEAGGVDTALEENFLVNVVDNYLEIHLYWAGKGTCYDKVCGPSIAGINVLPNVNDVDVSPPPVPSQKTPMRLVVGLSMAAVLASLVLIIFITLYIKKKKSDAEDDKDLIGIGPTFSYSELRNATDDFNEANKLGQGGFGPVYKGRLSDGRPIAVKQLSVSSHQGKCEFVAEIAIISAVRHQNLVKLFGCCIEKNRQLLVYEYLEKKSLDQALFGDKSLHLDWSDRFKICLGTARGLAYLHEELTPRIVHRDIKASNILLDAELCPKISDFGLAKLFDDRETHISTRIAGTIGYLSPEYAMFGHLTEKADIFGFGVVALEILSGRPNTINASDNKKQYLLEWAWDLYEKDRCLELVDPKLEEFDEEQAVKLVMVALWCTQSAPGIRPPMSRVIAMLQGDIEVSPVTLKPNYLTDMMTFNELPTSSFLSSEEASSSLLEGR